MNRLDTIPTTEIHNRSQVDAAMKIRVSLTERRIASNDGFTFPTSAQFYDLYVLLALRRKTDPLPGGYVDADELLLLPGWVRNDRLSIGKQVRRHVQHMERLGRNVIEAQQKIMGP